MLCSNLSPASTYVLFVFQLLASCPLLSSSVLFVFHLFFLRIPHMLFLHLSPASRYVLFAFHLSAFCPVVSSIYTLSAVHETLLSTSASLSTLPASFLAALPQTPLLHAIVPATSVVRHLYSTCHSLLLFPRLLLVCRLSGGNACIT